MKRDTAVNWTVNNPVLLNGEIILVDTDSGELRAKVGDGTKTYTQLPFTDEILKNLITGKQNKLTGTEGQIVGFGEDGSAQPEDFPGLTQEQADQRYVQQQNGNLVSFLGLIPSGVVNIGQGFDADEARVTPVLAKGAIHGLLFRPGQPTWSSTPTMSKSVLLPL